MTFATLLRRLRKKKYPTVRAFAKALQIDPAHLSRAMRPGGLPFDIRGCLRLARITGTDPAIVLRAAGKAEIADLLIELYPGDAPQRLANDEQQLLAANKAIHDPFTRRSLLEMARAAAGLLEERNH